MTSDTNKPLRIRRPRRRRNMVKVPRQPSPIAPFTLVNGWQVCTQTTAQQLNPSPADLLCYAFQKAVLTLASLGVDEFIKDLRTRRRGDTALDRLGREFFVAVVLEPARKGLADARSRS